jgi:hypothetical protein
MRLKKKLEYVSLHLRFSPLDRIIFLSV